MAKDLEEIDRMMNAHKNPQNKIDPQEEIIYTIKTILRYILYSGITIFVLGVIVALFVGSTDFDEIWTTLVNVSGYLFLIFGLFAAISYYAGMGVYMGEMTRRAWTNKRHTDKEIRKDFVSFIDTPRIIYSTFFASFIVITIDYLFIS